MRIRWILFVPVVLCCLMTSVLARPGPWGNGNDRQAAPAVSAAGAFPDNATWIDANRILMFVTNHGNVGRDLSGYFGYDYGTFYPYFGTEYIDDGSNTSSPLYAAGLWIGAVDSATQQTRVVISEYSSEYVPGPMAFGMPMPDNSYFKVYRLHHDSLGSNPNADYIDWPEDQGAPVDEWGVPVMIGHQMLWTVFNDADPSAHNNDCGETAPLGIEVQQTVWAEDEAGSDTFWIPVELPVMQYGSSSVTISARAIDGSDITMDVYQVEIDTDPHTGPYWNLKNVSTGQYLLENKRRFGTRYVVDGLSVAVYVPIDVRYGSWAYESAEPPNISPVTQADNPSYIGGRWFTGAGDGELFYGGVYMEPNFWGLTTVPVSQVTPVALKFRPMTSYTDLTGDGQYTFGESYFVDDPLQTQKAFMYRSLIGDTYQGFYDVPFTAWDISDEYNPRQVNVVVRDRDQNLQWDLNEEPYDPSLPNNGDLRFNYLWILSSDYDPTGMYYGDGTGGTVDFFGGDTDTLADAMWAVWLEERIDYGMLSEEGALELRPAGMYTMTFRDTFGFAAVMPQMVLGGNKSTSIYLKYKLYNKGDNVLEDCYLSLWADPDLGTAGDDLVGCDTLHDLFFCYNDVTNDLQYSYRPPASGFRIIHGPLVSSPGDTAVFDGEIVPDYKNLGMCTFAKYINGTDPDNFAEVYNYMQGRDPSGLPFDNGTLFMNPGDPVTGVGDIDLSGSDKRMMASCGPIDFHPGDSQYMLIKFAVGQGEDRLSSVTRLKEVLMVPPDFLVDADGDGTNALPGEFALFQNAPNPFNPVTRISYTVARQSEVELAVFNILGQKVATLVDAVQPAGQHTAVWDGTDNHGRAVATGVYLYRLKAGDMTATKKMLLLK